MPRASDFIPPTLSPRHHPPRAAGEAGASGFEAPQVRRSSVMVGSGGSAGQRGQDAGAVSRKCVGLDGGGG